MAGEENKVEFEIVRHIGVLLDGSQGWRTELNLVSWNKKPAKYDIRRWNADHSKMGKGVTLTKKELTELVRLAEAELEE